MSTLVADLIMEKLHEAGVARCYGIPGDTLNHICGSIRRSPIRWVHVRHEEAGAFAAAADAALTGELSMCAGSCGPGSLHFINGLMEAQRNRSPVICIASQIVREEIGFDFPQQVDFKAIFGGWTTFCEEVRTADHAEKLAVMAAQAAIFQRGVAVLILPSDVAAEHAKKIGHRVHRSYPVIRPADHELREIAAVLNDGGRVAIYAGAGCEGAHDQVVELARKLKAPVAYTSRAKSFVEYENPYAVGMTGVIGTRGGYQSVLKCDTLLLLGCGFAWRQFYPDDARILQIDIDGRNLGKRHPIQLGAVGDIGATVDALLPYLDEQEDGGFLAEMLQLKDKTAAKLNKPAHDPHVGKPMHPQFMIETIAKQADPDAVWAVDDGSAVVYTLRHVPATGQNRVLASLLHGTMAAGLASGLGAKSAFPDRQVIVIAGDGGLAMLMGDMITAVQERLPVKIAVLNNSSLGFVELEQRAEGMLPTYTDLENPDFSKVAAAIGYWSRRVEHGEELADAVKEWLAQPGPALLDVVVGRFELVMPPAIDPKAAVGMAIYGTRAVLSGRSSELIEMVEQNFVS
ncbi:Pyruvate dehydrogenase (quinone) (EC 1.2.5.1) [Azospirillum endophyticum]